MAKVYNIQLDANQLATILFCLRMMQANRDDWEELLRDGLHFPEKNAGIERLSPPEKCEPLSDGEITMLRLILNMQALEKE